VFDRLKTLTTEYQATEAVDLLVAGTDTTAFTLTRGIAMITGNPEIQNKLVNALREGLSSEPSGKPIELLKLEKIDYLVCSI
jgi:cytochrome P450